MAPMVVYMDMVEGAPNAILTIVPMTRPLRNEEIKQLLEYFCEAGVKMIPQNLPHAHGGHVFACELVAGRKLATLAKAQELPIEAYMMSQEHGAHERVKVLMFSVKNKERLDHLFTEVDSN